MKIYYIANDLKKLEALKRKEKSFLALRQDWWDDYTFKTYFQVYFFANGEEVEIPTIRILVENEKTTLSFFNNLVQQGWNGIFPISNVNYISVPSTVDFYKIIDGKLGRRAARRVAKSLKDAGFSVNVLKDENSSQLVQSEGFRTSLQRESGSIKAFEDGWKFLQELSTNIEDFSFRFRLRKQEEPINLEFRLNSEVLPYDINILVGPNGAGKSQALQNLVECLLKIRRGDPSQILDQGFEPFVNRPSISHIIVVSYSPFEDFIIDIDQYKLTDKEVYKYFGFRRKQKQEDKSVIGISRNKPATDSVESLLKCINEDQTYGYISDWVNKFSSAKEILHEAVEFDEIAFDVSEDLAYESIIDDVSQDNPIRKIGKHHYFILDHYNVGNIDVLKLSEYINKVRGVVLLKNNNVVHLSSGQRLFSYIVINILGSIKKNSLIIIDEPELFLHPNLEISYLSLLKSVLNYFRSKAIIATHSLVAVREVPRKCVHAFVQTDAGTVAASPPFETFGGDMQRISSYVFGDRSVTKPFEEWIKGKIQELGSPESVLEAFSDEINEETILFLRSLES